MDNLHIKGDFKNPSFDFDFAAGTLEIKGRSWPEHVLEIYDPAFEWLEEYKSVAQPKTSVKIMLEYFNTSSSKIVLAFIRKIEELHKSGHEVQVEWYHEEDDDELKEDGQTFANMVNIPIKLVPIEEFDFNYDE